MSKSNAAENDYLKLIFNAIPIANIADNAASAPLATLYLSLHTGDPGEAGDQTTNEISYTGYSRVGVARNSSGFTVTGNVVTLVAAAAFGQMTGGAGGVVTHAAVGYASSGAGKIERSGTVSPNITVVNGIAPILGTGTQFTED